jgi:hypothetical protein
MYEGDKRASGVRCCGGEGKDNGEYTSGERESPMTPIKRRYAATVNNATMPANAY